MCTSKTGSKLEPDFLLRDPHREGGNSAYVLQADQPPLNIMISVLVAEHYRPVYRFVNFLMGEVDVAKTLTHEVIMQAVWNRDSYRGFENPRVWLLKLAWRVYLDREENARPNLFHLYSFLRNVENLDHGEIVQLLEADQDKVSIITAERMEHLHIDGNLAINPNEWPLPNIGQHQLRTISSEILILIDSARRGLYREVTTSEALWTFMLSVLILAVAYWLNSSAETGNVEPIFPVPLSVPPTPQLVRMEVIPPILNESTEWSSMTVLGSFPFPVSGIDVSTYGEIYATGLGGNQIEYCRFEGTNQVILAEDFNPSLDEIAISSTGHLLATGTHDGSVLIWQWMEKGENRRLFTLRGHPGRIQALTFSQNGKMLAVGTARGTWLWKIEEVARLIRIIPGQDVSEIAFSYNSQWLATLERGDMIWIRSLNDGEVLDVLTGFPGSLLEFDFSPEDRLVVAAFIDGDFQFWSSVIDPNEDLRPLTFTSLLRFSLQPEDAWVSGLAFSSNGERLIFGTTRGDIYAIARSTSPEPEHQPFHYFERLPFNQFTDEEVHQINPGCGHHAWHQVLLNRPASINLEIAQIQLSLGEKFNLNIGGLEYLGSIPDRLNANSFFYKILEDNDQNVFLVIHEPNLIGPGVALAIDFLDRKVGAAARIESFQIDGILLEYLLGGWAFYITDEPVFFPNIEQFGDVQWRSEWETGSNQQTMRWKHAGRLFEIILLPEQTGNESTEGTLLRQDDLLDIARQIITHMKFIEITP